MTYLIIIAISLLVGILLAVGAIIVGVVQMNKAKEDIGDG